MTIREPSSSGAERHVIRRTAVGVFFAVGGQVGLFLASLLGSIFLSRLLDPLQFGIYAITAFVVLKLSAAAELGLNTNLIHDHAQPTIRQQRAIFTLHLIAAGAIYIALFLAAPYVSPLFKMGNAGVTFCRSVGVIILLHPFRTVPVGMLSRNLRYERLTWAELSEGITFQIVAVVLAFCGYGFWSFGIAVLAATVLGTVARHAFYPWRIGFAWERDYLRRCVRFGASFQLGSFTAIARDNIITFLGGPLFGPTAVGLLNWAYRLATNCSQTFVGICVRVSFPSFSRLRTNPELFSAAVIKMLRYTNLATLLVLSGVVSLAPEIVKFIFTAKWLTALPFFYWFAARMVANNYTTVLDFALKSQGKPERSLVIVSVWTAWEWALAIAGAILFGPLGIAAASFAGIWVAVIWLYIEVRRQCPALPILATIRTPLLSGVITMVAVLLVKGALVHSLFTLFLTAALGALLYAAVCALVEGRMLWGEVKSSYKLLADAQHPAVSTP